MYNIRDWCISRQLWWGHRIPAWHCGNCHEITVSREDPTECGNCGSKDIHQDPDVLDTWFSSGLFPFSTLGWPDDTEDLRAFYPTTLMVTGFDILFFWVARMIMLGLELTDQVPFRYVHLHGLVRDAERQKMSKTKGNVVDPILINDKYGTDAVRLSLVLGAASGRDIAFTEDRIEAARNFANKLWNATRFIFMNMERSGVETRIPAESAAPRFEDRWIQSRLHATIESMNSSLQNHRYHEAAQTIWHFFWDDFCDWYLEIKKLRFTADSGLNDDWRSLLTTFETGLRLLHPVMPFITEEISHRFDETTSISLKKYPDASFAKNDAAADHEMDLLKEIVAAARNIRQERKLDLKLVLKATLKTEADLDRAVIETLAKVQLIDDAKGVSRPGAEFDLIIELPEVSAEAIEAQCAKLRKQKEQLEKVIENSRRQLSNETFVSKAPEKILNDMRAKQAGYESEVSKTEGGWAPTAAHSFEAITGSSILATHALNSFVFGLISLPNSRNSHSTRSNL
jgi:valyl-tRNA synthetase